jgi:hypothetical protein
MSAPATSAPSQPETTSGRSSSRSTIASGAPWPSGCTTASTRRSAASPTILRWAERDRTAGRAPPILSARPVADRVPGGRPADPDHPNREGIARLVPDRAAGVGWGGQPERGVQ